ncbi:MAG: transporter substrate-binding domain-containing protein [Synergistaceae bacterium]|nr:transporter substrate-binding domain-containing protein [Synergistaceae bacterium]
MKKILLALLAVVLGAGFAWGNVMDKDVILAGTESTYPPYEFRDADNNLKGFDIDMVEAIAAKIGKKVEWVDMPFDSLIPSLLAKKIDIIAAGLSATEERAKKVAFSENYEISISAFIVKDDNNALKNVDDMKGKVIAVQLGTVQETYSLTIPDAQVKSFQKFDDCVREVILGRADATLMDVPVTKSYVEHKDFAGKIKVAFEQEITGSGKAMAMNLGETAFVEAVNGALKELEESGELGKMKEQWFK